MTEKDKSVQKEENKPQTEKVEAQGEPKKVGELLTDKEESQIETIQRKVEHLEAERLANAKEEMLEVEARIDNKIKDFKKFVDDTEVQGKSLAGAAVEENEEEKSKKAANKLLEGTGLTID